MPIVDADIFVDLPRDVVFRLTQDYYVRLDWDPFLKDIRFLDGAHEAAPGVRVWVKAWTGLTMTVEYISVAPPTVVAVEMIDGPILFDKFAGTWRFNAVSEEVTHVTFRYSFITRWKWLRPLIDPIVQRLFRRDIRKRLLQLKRVAEETDIKDRLDMRVERYRNAG